MVMVVLRVVMVIVIVAVIVVVVVVMEVVGHEYCERLRVFSNGYFLKNCCGFINMI